VSPSEFDGADISVFPPSLESVFILPSPPRHHQPPAIFPQNRLQSPSRVAHHRLSTRDSDLGQIRDALSDSDWHHSPRLTHAFLQEPLHLASPIDESIADRCYYCLLQLLGHPCFFFRHSALEVLSSFDTSARRPGTDNTQTPSVENFITIRRYIPHLPTPNFAGTTRGIT